MPQAPGKDICLLHWLSTNPIIFNIQQYSNAHPNASQRKIVVEKHQVTRFYWQIDTYDKFYSSTANHEQNTHDLRIKTPISELFSNKKADYSTEIKKSAAREDSAAPISVGADLRM